MLKFLSVHLTDIKTTLPVIFGSLIREGIYQPNNVFLLNLPLYLRLLYIIILCIDYVCTGR